MTQDIIKTGKKLLCKLTTFPLLVSFKYKTAIFAFMTGLMLLISLISFVGFNDMIAAILSGAVGALSWGTWIAIEYHYDSILTYIIVPIMLILVTPMMFYSLYIKSLNEGIIIVSLHFIIIVIISLCITKIIMWCPQFKANEVTQ
jgi:hypothetical protein